MSENADSVQVTLTVAFSVEGDVDLMVRQLVEYLTSDEGVLHEDYGPGAWGGYDGPYITAVTVARDGTTLQSADWGQREDDEDDDEQDEEEES